MSLTFDYALGKLRKVDSGVQGPPGPKGDTGATGQAGADGTGVTPQTVGFTLTGGTTPKTLTVALDANVSGTNTGDQDISVKVDKVAGKSLVADTEISKIHAPESDNQDLSGLVVKESGKSLVADTEIAKIHASGSDNQDLSGLVVKEAGKSLVADTEIAKIHASGSDNQDLSGLEPKQAGKSLSTNDFTDDLESKLIGIEAGANNYTHPATHSADIIIDGTTNKVYTATEQSKLSGIATGAEVNVQSDWNQSTNTADDYIKNKPTIPTALADLSEDSTHRIVTDTEKSTWNGKAAGDHTHTGTYAPASHTQAASTITDFDTEVSNNTDVSGNTSARHTHANAVALAAVTNTNTGDQDLSVFYTKTEVDNLISALKTQMSIDKRVD